MKTQFGNSNRRYLRREGFTLLVTLAVLAIGTLVMASIAIHSSNLVFQSRSQLKDLRARWAEYSCQRTLLRNPQKTLESSLDEGPTHLTKRQFSLQMNNSFVQITVSDENAKADLNELNRRVSKFQLEAILRKVSPSEKPIYLRPLKKNQKRSLIEKKYGCWEQVWDQADGNLQAWTGQVTLWGNRLNPWTADPEILKEFSAPFLGEIATMKLLREIEKGETKKLKEIYKEIEFNQRQIEICRYIFTDVSHSYSLWFQGDCKGNGTKSLLVKEGIPVEGNRSVIFRNHYFSW